MLLWVFTKPNESIDYVSLFGILLWLAMYDAILKLIRTNEWIVLFVVVYDRILMFMNTMIM